MILGTIDIAVILFIGGLFVGLIKYIWNREFKSMMTPEKCKVSHKEILDDIKVEFKNHRENMEKFFSLEIENKILKELREINNKR